MKTMTFRETNITHRALLVALLVVALSVLLIISARPAYADGATYTIKGSYVVNSDGEISSELTNVTTLPGDVTTTFKTYRVGSFAEGHDEQGKAHLELTGKFKDAQNVKLDIDKDSYDGDEVAWTKAWLASAQTLYNFVKSQDPPIDPNFTTTSNEQGEFTLTNVENGLYLITGSSKEIKDYPKPNKSSYWYPQPMLVLVWNGDVTIKIKPMIQSLTELRVHKAWEGDEDVKALSRPESIDVIISYDGVQYGEPITLSDENEWNYSWKVIGDKDDPSKWACTEVFEGNDKLRKNYKFTTEPISPNGINDGVHIVTITNTYDRDELQLTKSINKLIQNANDSTSFVFELSGYYEGDAEDKPSYHKFVGIDFKSDSSGSEMTTVKDIPLGLKKLVVKEKYAGNYTSHPSEKTLTAPTNGVYVAEFSNTLTGKTPGSGIVNKGVLKLADEVTKMVYDSINEQNSPR